MGELKLYLFGPPRVEMDNAPLDLQRRKALAMLAYLAATGQPHSRDALATLFWPDLDQQRARAYFRRDLAALNTGLPGNWLSVDRETVELNREAGLWVDTAQFQRVLIACQRHDHPAESVCADCLPLLAEAAALYTGDFLAGFTLRDSPEFDDWQFFQTESLRQELASALERLVQGLHAQGKAEAAIPHARRWVALDPLHEPAQRQLIQVYDQAGQPAAALRQYEEYVRLLEEELGLPPEEETTTLYEAIKAKRILQPFLKARRESPPVKAQVQATMLPPEQYATASTRVETPVQPAAGRLAEAAPQQPGRPEPVERGTPRHNLPSQLSPLIGREAELGQIRRLLLDEPDCRLLTLVGPGGTGKTRLALAAGAALLEAFPHGVYFVSLAPVSEPEFIVSAIAEALNFNFAGAAEPKEQLLTYLHEKNLLLVVDNFEHLLGGAELLSEILHTAPRVSLLVTSRERLNLQEEWSNEVGGMTFPRRGDTIPVDDSATLEPYSALRLFLQRARQAQASFSLSAEDMPYAVRICELVDGLPLGLELAAPWVRLMPCREIAAELERNLDILSTSLRNVPERHRSIRAVFEQTWERLLPEEQAVLSQLSIFRGGCLRPAAEAVTGATLPRLLSLVDKALLRRTSSGRYEMHELIRQFSLEQLQANLHVYEQVQDRHYAYYTAFLHQQTAVIKSGPQKEALEAITADFDNIRAAWHRAVECKDAYALEQAAECLCLYSEMRGALHEGEAAFQQAVTALAVPPPALDKAAADALENLRGFLLASQGMLCAHRGELQAGQSLMEQGLSLLRQFPHPERHRQQEAFTLLWLGWLVFLQGKTSEAEACIEESLALFSAVGDRWGVAKSLFVLGNSLTARGLLAESEPPLRESLAICQEIDDRRSRLLVNRNLAILTLWFGDYNQTRQLLDEAASLSREFNDQIGLAYTLRERGVLETAQGEYERAMQTLQESIAITDAMGSHWESAAALDDVATVLRLTGDYVAAEWALNQCLEASQAINNVYYTARCLGNLGCVAYHKGEYQQAEQRLQQALELWAGMGHDPYRAWVLSQLGHVSAKKSRPGEAGEYYWQALLLSTRHNLAPFALEVFVGAARLLLQAGQTEHVAQLLTLAQHHPAGTAETKGAARDFLEERTTRLSGELTAASPLDWQTVAGQIIEVLSTKP
ncbi:MAG: tetratricopeptide repeat protein [Anaerolineales bacterium]|nr:tetratricopeptide repeat protein [Anaerolineales bacterium]